MGHEFLTYLHYIKRANDLEIEPFMLNIQSLDVD